MEKGWELCSKDLALPFPAAPAAPDVRTSKPMERQRLAVTMPAAFFEKAGPKLMVGANADEADRSQVREVNHDSFDKALHDVVDRLAVANLKECTVRR